MTMAGYPSLLAGQGTPFLQVSPLLTTGKVFFVNSVVGKANNVGDDSLRPLATWQQAINKCRANKGDYVVIMPGHAESVTTAAGINLNVAGVRHIMMGVGASRPIFTLSGSTAASIDVTAANNHISGGMVVDATGIDAIIAAMNIQAADCSIFDLRMILATASAQAVLGILTNASADRFHLARSRFEGTIDAGTSAAVRIVGGDGIVIGGRHDLANWFYGAYTGTVGALQGLTTDCTNILVTHNFISNITAGSTKAMVFTATSTGAFGMNYMAILAGAAPVTGAALNNLGGGYYSASAGVTAATLI